MDKISKQLKNRELVEQFPFLLPRNVWNDSLPKDYDYSYTILDMMPDGWRIAFGEQICEEIKEELIKNNFLEDYRISQIKEKYGRLCWYDFGCTPKIYMEIIPKYTKLSKRTCINCGAPATKITTGYISPFCDKCIAGYTGEDLIDINNYYNEAE